MQSVTLADAMVCKYPAADELAGFCRADGVGRGGGGELQAFCTPGRAVACATALRSLSEPFPKSKGTHQIFLPPRGYDKFKKN